MSRGVELGDLTCVSLFSLVKSSLVFVLEGQNRTNTGF